MFPLRGEGAEALLKRLPKTDESKNKKSRRFHRPLKSVFFFDWISFLSSHLFRKIRIQRGRLTGKRLRLGCAASQPTKAAAGRLVRTHEGPGRDSRPGARGKCRAVPPPPVCAAKLRKKNALLLQRVLFWRYHPDLNRGITVLQTVALPLGYGTEYGADDGVRVSGGDLSKRSFEKHRPRREPRTRTRSDICNM